MPKEIFTEKLCGMKRCCPTVSVQDDGSIVVKDDDAEKGSVGNVIFDKDQTDRLLDILLTKRG